MTNNDIIKAGYSNQLVQQHSIVNPHQRCGYSDSPFARKDTFPYCRVQKWVGR